MAKYSNFCVSAIIGVVCLRWQVHSQEDTCEAPYDGMETKLIGSLTPSAVLIIDDFLSEAITRSTFDDIVQKPWESFIPEHRTYYENWDKAKDGKLMRAPISNKGGYPGTRANFTEAYEEALKARIDSLDFETIFDIESMEKSWQNYSVYFGNTCYSPSSLGVGQRAPHLDRTFTKKHPVKLAIVHYLSHSFPAAGGTAFYQEVSSGGSRFLLKDCKALKAKAKSLGYKSGETRYLKQSSCHCRPHGKNCDYYSWYSASVPEGYMSESTSQYELLLHVPYKYNRAVVYHPLQLHSAYVDDYTLQSLTCDPKHGRVTANAFLS